MRPSLRRPLLWIFVAGAALAWTIALAEWRRPGVLLPGHSEGGGYHHGDCDAGPQSRLYQFFRCWDAGALIAGLAVAGAACGGAALALRRRAA